MLKFELDEYNPSVLRHIGNALVSIAADREAERGKEVTECTLGERVKVYGLTAVEDQSNVHPGVFAPGGVVVPPVAGQLAGDAFQAPPPPVAEEPLPQGTALPPAHEPTCVSGLEEDDDFPDPPNTVPAPPAADVAPPPPSLPDLDSAGIPWDARIHAATKTKCKDGSWKNKPGVDAALLASVTAELKGVQALPVPPAPAATVPPAPPAAAAGPTTFAELMKELTPLLVPGGKLTAQQVNEACQVHGLPNCGALGARPDLIPTVWSQLCLILG